MSGPSTLEAASPAEGPTLWPFLLAPVPAPSSTCSSTVGPGPSALAGSWGASASQLDAPNPAHFLGKATFLYLV